MNPIFTVIARVSDGLMLAEAMDSADSKITDIESYRTQAKKIIKSLSHKSPTKLTIDSDPNYFCYVMENDVCYLSLCEKSYPKKLAVKFLEELQKEFDIQYGADIPSTKRPYAFIKFGIFFIFIFDLKRNLFIFLFFSYHFF
jgi:vesicle transport protein SEC22